jgi:hypothetical protein
MGVGTYRGLLTDSAKEERSMADQSNREESIRWLLEPPEPGVIHYYLEVGEGAEVTPEFRAAFEQLLSSLDPGAEVSGHTCNALTIKNCLTKLSCGGFSYPGCDGHWCAQHTCRICSLSHKLF